MKSIATFETSNAERYMKTLCKHFAHKVPVTTEAESGQVEFPFGRCDLTAADDGLRIVATAKDQWQLSKVIEIVTSHIELFAFRENPTLAWRTKDVSA